MKPTTALFILAALIVTVFLSAKPNKEVVPVKRTTVVSVCHSAINCKKILDVYFKLGYTLDSPITTQIIAKTPKSGSISTEENHFGATYEREYIIILSK